MESAGEPFEAAGRTDSRLTHSSQIEKEVHNMPGTTYIIRFTHRTLGSGIPYEEQEHIDLAQA